MDPVDFQGCSKIKNIFREIVDVFAGVWARWRTSTRDPPVIEQNSAKMKQSF